MAQWVGDPALEVSGHESYLHHPYKELHMLVHVCIPLKSAIQTGRSSALAVNQA